MAGARAAALFATATEQISELIDLLATQSDAVLMLPCPGRGKLGDGSVGATAAHTAASYHRIAAFLEGTADADGGEHQAPSLDRDDLLERLSSARHALASLAQLTDEQLDVVPVASEMRFCDGRRTLEEILSSLLKHQRHQIDAVKAAVG
jgi:hypothetical protein